MKPQITITIDGPQGAGKSILAQHLGNYLCHQHGIKVVLYDSMNGGQISSSYAELPNHFDADVTINVEQK